MVAVSEKFWTAVYILAILLGLYGIHYNGADILDYACILSGATGLVIQVLECDDNE